MIALRAVVLAGALALGGCAALTPPQTRALTAALPPGLPERVERTEVPFFPQTPQHCGPAALATALSHAGLPTTPADLSASVFLPAREGSLQVEMLAGARQRGALAYRLPGELSALLRELAAGHAVVVLQNLGLDWLPRWHYAVLVGYDLPRRELLLRSGVTQREVMSLDTFEHTWARGGHWAMLALPPGRLPVAVDEAAALQAALGFERGAPPRAAARAYEALLARWPASLAAAIGLGNARLAAGDPRGAGRAFAQAARQHDSAAAWNNLAQARLRSGELPAARAAAQRALARARQAEPQWLAAALETERELAQAARTPR